MGFSRLNKKNYIWEENLCTLSAKTSSAVSIFFNPSRRSEEILPSTADYLESKLAPVYRRHSAAGLSLKERRRARVGTC